MPAERILGSSSEIQVIALEEGGVEIRTPNAQPKGIILKPGERLKFRFSAACHVVGHIPGVGFDDNLNGAFGDEIDEGERPALG
jgi:hypothetical protein